MTTGSALLPPQHASATPGSISRTSLSSLTCITASKARAVSPPVAISAPMLAICGAIICDRFAHSNAPSRGSMLSPLPMTITASRNSSAALMRSAASAHAPAMCPAFSTSGAIVNVTQSVWSSSHFACSRETDDILPTMATTRLAAGICGKAILASPRFAVSNGS